MSEHNGSLTTFATTTHLRSELIQLTSDTGVCTARSPIAGCATDVGVSSGGRLGVGHQSGRWSKWSRRYEALLVGHTAGQLASSFLQLFLGPLQLYVPGVELCSQSYGSLGFISCMLQQRPPLPLSIGVVLGAIVLRLPNSLFKVTDEVSQFLFLVLQRGTKLLNLNQQVTLVRSEFLAFQFET